MGTTETMDCDNDIPGNGFQGKNGRPSYLVQYREFWRPGGIIEPLLVAPVNIADWFAVYGGYIYRAFRTGESSDSFSVPDPMRQYIEQRLTELTLVHGLKNVPRPIQADQQLSRLVDEPADPDSKNLKLTLRSPSARLSKTGWERACRLGSALMSLARRRSSPVQSAVLGYCLAATTRRYVIMTGEQDAVYGRLLIELVRELHLKGLKVHLVGFRVGYNPPDIGRWLRILELRAMTSVEFEMANNVESMARLNHVGIKVCWGESSRASREWHEVALLAAITELWRCVAPSHGFELMP